MAAGAPNPPDPAPATPGPTTVRLRSPAGRPLADPALRQTVLAAARALAERAGLTLLALEATDRTLTATLATDRLTALGFLTELRNSTNAWYQAKFDAGPLWPALLPEDDVS